MSHSCVIHREEFEYRIDVYRVTIGARIEYLYLIFLNLLILFKLFDA
jgi:hypothetical protein